MLSTLMKLLVGCLMLLLRPSDAENLVFGRSLSDENLMDTVCISRHWFSLKPRTVEQRFPRHYGYYQHPINFIGIRDNINNWAGRYPYITRGGVSENYVQLSFYAPIMRGLDYNVRIYTSAALNSFLQSPPPTPKPFNFTESPQSSAAPTTNATTRVYNTTVSINANTETSTVHATPNTTNLLESTREKQITTALTTSIQTITPAPLKDSFVNTTRTEVLVNASTLGTETTSYKSEYNRTIDTAMTTLSRETSVTIGETAPTNPSANDTSKGTRDETISTTATAGTEKSNTTKPQNNTSTDISGNYIPQTTPMPDTKSNDSTLSVQTNITTLSPKLFTENSTTVSEGSSTVSSDDEPSVASSTDTTLVSLTDLSTPNWNLSGSTTEMTSSTV